MYTSMYRALSWSNDAWALIALIALLSAILVLGNIVFKFGTFDTYSSRSEGTSIVTNVSHHVFGHNNIFI